MMSDCVRELSDYTSSDLSGSEGNKQLRIMCKPAWVTKPIPNSTKHESGSPAPRDLACHTAQYLLKPTLPSSMCIGMRGGIDAWSDGGGSEGGREDGGKLMYRTSIRNYASILSPGSNAGGVSRITCDFFKTSVALPYGYHRCFCGEHYHTCR